MNSLIWLNIFVELMKRPSELIVQTFELQGYRFQGREQRSLIFMKDHQRVRVYLFREKLTREALSNLPEERKIVICLSGWEDGLEPDPLTEIWDRNRFFSLLGESMFESALTSGVRSHIFRLPRGRRGKGYIPEEREEGIVQNNVDIDKVKDLGKRVDGFHYEMRLLPWYLIDLSYKESGKDRMVSLAIDATTGRGVKWTSMLVLKDDIAWPYNLLEPKVSAEDAIAIAKKTLISMESKKLKLITEELETATVIDRVPVFDHHSIRVMRIRLFHFPVWIVEGIKGMMIINGATGEVIEESFFES